MATERNAFNIIVALLAEGRKMKFDDDDDGGMNDIQYIHQYSLLVPKTNLILLSPCCREKETGVRELKLSSCGFGVDQRECLSAVTVPDSSSAVSINIITVILVCVRFE
jgi:hypothetical protein